MSLIQLIFLYYLCSDFRYIRTDNCTLLEIRLYFRINWASQLHKLQVESSWNVMAQGDAREEKWSGNWRMEWVTSNLHTTSEHVVSIITTADAHTSAASSQLNWRPSRFKWTRAFRRKTKSGFCACAITFQTLSTIRTVGEQIFWLQLILPYRRCLFATRKIWVGPTLQCVFIWLFKVYYHCNRLSSSRHRLFKLSETWLPKQGAERWAERWAGAWAGKKNILYMWEREKHTFATGHVSNSCKRIADSKQYLSL